jgi:DNA/RNA-binding domain of Phe-tRNA-synthetase-like protein
LNKEATEFPITIGHSIHQRVPTLFAKTHVVRGVQVRPAGERLNPVTAALIETWLHPAAADLSQYPLIVAYRDLMWSLGVDPLVTVPAVEGFLLRMMKRRAFPRINSVVDAVNAISITSLIPIGAFDLDKIYGSVEMTRSVEGEEILPIGGKSPLKLPQGVAILKDSAGVISIIGSRDSSRTMMTERTRNVLLASWGMQGIEEGKISRVLEDCARALVD